jgi:hypothetical protein
MPVNLRHGTPQIYFPSERKACWEFFFFALKNPTASADVWTRELWGSKGQHGTPRPPNSLHVGLLATAQCQSWILRLSLRLTFLTTDLHKLNFILRYFKLRPAVLYVKKNPKDMLPSYSGLHKRLSHLVRVARNVTIEIHERGRVRQTESCGRFIACNSFSPVKEADSLTPLLYTHKNSFHLGSSAQVEVIFAVSNSWIPNKIEVKCNTIVSCAYESILLFYVACYLVSTLR